MREDQSRNYRNNNTNDDTHTPFEQQDNSMSVVGAFSSNRLPRNQDRRDLPGLTFPSPPTARRQQHLMLHSISMTSEQRNEQAHSVLDILNEALQVTGAVTTPSRIGRSHRSTSQGLNNILTQANVFPSSESSPELLPSSPELHCLRNFRSFF